MSVLLTQNTTSASLSAGATVPLGSAVHGCGKGLNLNNNAIVVSGNGFYSFDASVTVLPTTDTAETLNLLENGVIVASASATPATAGDPIELSIPWTIRKTGCACNSKSYTLTLASAGTIASVITRTMSA